MITPVELDMIDERAHLAPFLIRKDVMRLIAEVRRLQADNNALRAAKG